MIVITTLWRLSRRFSRAAVRSRRGIEAGLYSVVVTSALFFPFCAGAAADNTSPRTAREIVLEGGIAGKEAVMMLTQRGDSLSGYYYYKGDKGGTPLQGNMKDSMNIMLNEYHGNMPVAYFKLYYGEYDGDEFIGGERIEGHTSQTVLFHEKSSRPLPPAQKSGIRFKTPVQSGKDAEKAALQAELEALKKQESHEASAGSTVYDVAEAMPEFPGGVTALMRYILTNLRYPSVSQENKVQGRVIVRFVVRSDGKVSDATVIRSVDPFLDREALRVINSMPRWKPGMQKGKPVNVRYTLPIAFRLQ